MKVKDRLITFLKHENLGQKAFEIKAGLSNGFVNRIGDSVTTNSLKKIKDAFPGLNTNWLMTGEGTMLEDYIEFDVGSAIREIKESNAVILSTCAEILAAVTNQSSTVLREQLADLVKQKLNPS